jgi:esterase/lipase superfamily enzyme
VQFTIVAAGRGAANAAAFANRRTTVTVTTTALGQALAPALQPLSSGALQINIQATYQGQAAQAVISQTNYLTVADAAKAGRTQSTPRQFPGEVPSGSSGGSSEARIELAVVPVFYATDRARLAGSTVSYGMNRNPSGSLHLGRFDVSVPRDHKMGHMERPKMWSFRREDPARHFVIRRRRQQSYEDFYNGIRALVGISTEKEAFVFVHGFNVAFDDAIFRAAQIAYDLGFEGAPILYSWPSAESMSPVGYATDSANNDWTVPHLRWFLEDVATRTGTRRVHLIAHSMGNKALVNALDRMPLSATRKFSQIVLTAPDVDADTFVQLANAVKRHGQRTTLYASANDKALLASKQLQTYRRAGDTAEGVLVVEGIDTVDVSAVDTDLVGHFYYGDNRSVLSDMFLLLTQNLPPTKRPQLRPSGTAPNQFWQFVP